jgi:GNAT superfamily N-acetyltransferase
LADGLDAETESRKWLYKEQRVYGDDKLDENDKPVDCLSLRIQHQRSGNGALLVAEEAERIVSQLYIDLVCGMGRRIAGILDVRTLEECKRFGIATTLLGTAEKALALSKSFDYVTLTVEKQNDAQRLYKEVGYQLLEPGWPKPRVLLIDDKIVTLMKMVKI